MSMATSTSTGAITSDAAAAVDDSGRLVVDGLPPGAIAQVVIARPGDHEGWAWTRSRKAVAGFAVAMIVGIAVIATVGRRWSWSGFSGQDTLWSWMSLLAQPGRSRNSAP
jgi:hypothetical protein